MPLQNIPPVEVHAAPVVLARELREAVGGFVPAEMVRPPEVPVARVAPGMLVGYCCFGLFSFFRCLVIFLL